MTTALRLAVLAGCGVFAGLSVLAAVCCLFAVLSLTVYPAGYGVAWMVVSLLAACGSLCLWDEFLRLGAQS